MHLHISTPFAQIVDAAATRIYATTALGAWCILPRHMDMVMALAPGLLTYCSDEAEEQALAVNGGVLVKAGSSVHISTREAMTSRQLTSLSEDVRAKFADQSDEERRAQTSLARLEAGIIRKLLALEARHAQA